MSWTGFVFEMTDGNIFSFGTSFQAEFINLPNGYSFEDVKNVYNHSYVDSNNEITSIKSGMNDSNDEYDCSKVYREMPYFDCYVD